ncbi:hypothetical protein QVD17_38247 [Tagetes erecta]|uniref:Uncharacterized protein n=1 Tax=Tagetes erecta TaxID=13708 RepID=A0AAD8JZT3_TARER|nr:hypothetical protein QVD17_38247 [Tagetes erecta]
MFSIAEEDEEFIDLTKIADLGMLFEIEEFLTIVKQGLGGRVSGAAPLAPYVEAYLKVVTCSLVYIFHIGQNELQTVMDFEEGADLWLPPWEVDTILTGGLALSGFALSGLYCTHQDISPEYASILLICSDTSIVL